MALPLWISRTVGGTRARIVEELQREPATVAQLSSRLAIATHAVRAHLTVLERDGLVERMVLHRARRGKPAYEYRITAAAAVQLSSAYAAASACLISVIGARSSPPDLSALLSAAGRELALRVRLADPRPRSRVESAASAFTALGGAAELIERPRILSLTSRSCPLAAINGEHSGGCELLEGFIAEITHLPVRQRCVRDGEPRCVFEIGRESAAPDASGHSGE